MFLVQRVYPDYFIAHPLKKSAQTLGGPCVLASI